MKPDTQSFYELATRRVALHIVSRLDEALDLQSLARQAALSALHFHHVFRGMLGETPLELQRRLRMERAAWQLSTTSGGVTSIALSAGYETHEAFTRAFRRHYGMPPLRYRQRARELVEGCGQAIQYELAARCGLHFDPDAALPVVEFVKGGNQMKVDITELPELRLAAVRHAGPYNQIARAFQRLGEIVHPAGLVADDAAMVAVYYDDPETTPADQLRADAGISVSPTALLPPTLREVTLASGRYAHTTHVGPYAQLGDVWARFMGEWLPASGRRVADGVGFEIYRNTPADVAPAELITELYVPVR